MIKQFFFFLIIPFNLLLAQVNTAPEVTNVAFSQRADGSFMVDVYYDVNDSDGDTMSVKMYVSDDTGTSWNFSCTNISGDVGVDITSGTGKHIVWDFGGEHPQTFGEQFQIKIIANDWNIEVGTLTDIDGNLYKTVRIGEQWWMEENLKVTHYRNGEMINNVQDNTEWSNLSSGAYCTYDNDNGNIETYGILYNCYAVKNNRNIAPIGWHVPTDEEFMQLEMYLGMSRSVANGSDWRGTDEGSKLQATEGWPYEIGTNESGFLALPGGYRNESGSFGNLGYGAYFWSSSEFSKYYDYLVWNRHLNFNHLDIRRIHPSKKYGLSVRLVKD